MIHKKPVILLLPLFFALGNLAGNPLVPQGFPLGSVALPEEILKAGIGLYGEGRFTEAAAVLRYVEDGPFRPEALYWISLSGIGARDFGGALRDRESLEQSDPRGRWAGEIPYHRGRCYYYLGRYEEALVTLKDYADSAGNRARLDAAYYWIGESLLALGRLDNAAAAFSVVAEKYPSSPKYEAAVYRLELINQKKIEAELLSMLKWSHEESLKTLEDYRLREKSYEQAIAAYEQRLAGQPPAQDEDMAAAQARIALLEASLNEANAALAALRGTGTEFLPASDYNSKVLRLLELKSAALELSNTLNRKLLGE